MDVVLYSARDHDRTSFARANEAPGHRLRFVAARLDPVTAGHARGADAVCVFVNDRVDREVVDVLADQGIRVLALRSTGFNHVDLRAAEERGITVIRVPAYSPHAVAEHTVGLLLALVRRLHRAHARVREGNFSLRGLLGFDLHGRTVGVVGTGRIGTVFARILRGFGCRILAHDPEPSPALVEEGVRYVSFDALLEGSDVVSLHCPLTPETHHLIDADAIARMRPGVTLLNTSRGGLVDTRALTDGLKSGRIGHLGLDVYEEEGDLFFEDLSDTVLQDDVFARLLTFPNVLVTGHQAFFTEEALAAIADTTLRNLDLLERGEACADVLRADEVLREGPEAVGGAS